jgi:hypothetical protein
MKTLKKDRKLEVENWCAAPDVVYDKGGGVARMEQISGVTPLENELIFQALLACTSSNNRAGKSMSVRLTKKCKLPNLHRQKTASAGWNR